MASIGIRTPTGNKYVSLYDTPRTHNNIAVITSSGVKYAGASNDDTQNGPAVLGYKSKVNSWTSATEPFADIVISQMIHANGKYVCVGSGGKIFHSVDADTWTEASVLPFDENTLISCVCYGKPVYNPTYTELYVVGTGDGRIAYSFDADNWTALADPIFDNTIVNSICYCNDTFIAVGDGSNIVYISYNANKITWYKSQNYTGPADLKGICYNEDNNMLVVATSKGSIVYSTGLSDLWTELPLLEGPDVFACIYYAHNRFVIGTRVGAIFCGPDIHSLTAKTVFSSTTIAINSVCFGDGAFMTVGTKGKISYSYDDCNTWHEVTDAPYGSSIITTACYGDGKFVIGGWGQKIAYTSPVTRDYTVHEWADQAKVSVLETTIQQTSISQAVSTTYTIPAADNTYGGYVVLYGASGASSGGTGGKGSVNTVYFDATNDTGEDINISVVIGGGAGKAGNGTAGTNVNYSDTYCRCPTTGHSPYCPTYYSGTVRTSTNAAGGGQGGYNTQVTVSKGNAQVASGKAYGGGGGGGTRGSASEEYYINGRCGTMPHGCRCGTIAHKTVYGTNGKGGTSGNGTTSSSQNGASVGQYSGLAKALVYLYRLN